jgi:hypothetical protein
VNEGGWWKTNMLLVFFIISRFSLRCRRKGIAARLFIPIILNLTPEDSGERIFTIT